MDDMDMMSEECDEKRSFTPDPKLYKGTQLNQQANKKLNYSVIGLGGAGRPGGINEVYKTSKLDISSYISKNKSYMENKNCGIDV
mmetsp:Transcript_16211/g.15607  ORF Transcript_16211/g.15607 Transcript_16211/m.15607 type:complete len:85 (-) Transcript_16211:799-1053(-)